MSNQTSTMAMKECASVLLLTATAYALGEDHEKKIKVNILFDGGIKNSYIADDLKKRLSLKAKKTEKSNLTIFGSEKYTLCTCESIKLHVEVESGQVTPISMLSFPVSCSPVSTCVYIKDYPHLQGLRFADTFDSDKDISILVGTS